MPVTRVPVTRVPVTRVPVTRVPVTPMRSQLLIAALAALACAPAARPQFPARPPGCALEPVERLPRRPYIELETFSLPGPESMREVLDLVNERACRDGADAVYAPKGGRTYSYAIALKWNDPPPPAAPPSPAPALPPAPAPPAPALPPAPAPPALLQTAKAPGLAWVAAERGHARSWRCRGLILAGVGGPPVSQWDL